jgi:hypothetical protein
LIQEKRLAGMRSPKIFHVMSGTEFYEHKFKVFPSFASALQSQDSSFNRLDASLSSMQPFRNKSDTVHQSHLTNNYQTIKFRIRTSMYRKTQKAVVAAEIFGTLAACRDQNEEKTTSQSTSRLANQKRGLNKETRIYSH